MQIAARTAMTHYLAKLWLILLLLGGLSVATPSLAQTPQPKLQYLVDAEQQLTLERVLEYPASAWQVVENDEASFGYTTDTYWFISHIDEAAFDRIVHIGYPLLDSVQVYFVRDGELLGQYHVGDQQPYKARPIDHKNFVFELPDRGAVTLVMRIQTESSMRFSFSVWKPVEFHQQQQYIAGSTAVYFGLLLCMMVYNFFSFGVTRDVSFLNYAAYIFSIGLLLAGLDGTGYQYLWPEWPWLQDRIVTMIGSLVFIFASQVAAQVLMTKQRGPNLHRALRLSQVVYSIIFIASLIFAYSTIIPYVLIAAVLGCTQLMITGIVLWRRGLNYARIYTLALGCLLFAISCNALGYLGWFDSIFIQRYAIMLASALEIMLLSLVLAIRFNDDRRHRLLAERRLNSELELMVQQRTQELEQALDQLRVANTELDKKSKQDRLTGLFNRGYMDEELPREIRRAKRSGQDLTLMMLDIDHFKALNDQHGHLLGDLVLTQLAELLQDLTQRGGDRVFRYGGEEFAILLPATDEIGARETANRIADAIRTMPIQYHDMQLQITVSIGIAVYYAATMEVTPEAFIGAADDALYQAKNAGRDQIRLARIEAPFR